MTGLVRGLPGNRLLRGQGPDALMVYLRNLRLGLYDKADRAFLEAK